MEDIFWCLFEISVNLAEELIVFYFICSFLNHDLKTVKGKIVYYLGAALGTIYAVCVSYNVTFAWWRSIFYVLYWFAFAFAFLKGKVLRKLSATIIACAVLLVTSSFTTGILSFAFNTDTAEFYTTHEWHEVLGLLICQVLNLLLYNLILKLINRDLSMLSKKEWSLIISLLLISLLSVGMIRLALGESSLSQTTSLMLIMWQTGLFALNILCLNIVVSLNKSNRIAEELKLSDQQFKQDIKYAESVQKQYREIRCMRHDIKQHLATVSGLQLEGKYDEAQKYISEVSNNIEKVEMFVDVGNDFVNAILNSKLSLGKSKGINVLCNSTSKIEGINEYDLCGLIGNMLDNAIEAAEKVKENAVIEASIMSDNYKLIITVSNTVSESVLGKNPDLKSTKDLSEMHGFGVKSIRSVAKKYDGIVDFYEEELMFICRVVLCKK